MTVERVLENAPPMAKVSLAASHEPTATGIDYMASMPACCYLHNCLYPKICKLHNLWKEDAHSQFHEPFVWLSVEFGASCQTEEAADNDVTSNAVNNPLSFSCLKWSHLFQLQPRRR